MVLGVFGSQVDRFDGAPREGGEQHGHDHREACQDAGDNDRTAVRSQEGE
jgi:hypothetical protein